MPRTAEDARDERHEALAELALLERVNLTSIRRLMGREDVSVERAYPHPPERETCTGGAVTRSYRYRDPYGRQPCQQRVFAIVRPTLEAYKRPAQGVRHGNLELPEVPVGLARDVLERAIIGPIGSME